MDQNSSNTQGTNQSQNRSNAPGGSNYRPKRNNNRRRKPRPYNPNNSSSSSSGSDQRNTRPQASQPQQKSSGQKSARSGEQLQQQPQQQQQQQQHQQQLNKQTPQRDQRPVYNKTVKPGRSQNRWDDRKVMIEETFEDVRKDNERIEKEIWLEIAEIHNLRLD